MFNTYRHDMHAIDAAKCPEIQHQDATLEVVGIRGARDVNPFRVVPEFSK